MVHRMRQGARGLIRRNRARTFEALLPWHRIQQLLDAARDGLLPDESLRDIVALINYRVVMFIRQPPHPNTLHEVEKALLELEDNRSLSNIERALLALRLGQIITLTGRHNVAQLHYHKATCFFELAREPLGEAAAYMLLARSQQNDLLFMAADAYKEALHILAATNDRSRRKQTLELRYIARRWIAEMYALRGETAKKLWHRTIAFGIGCHMAALGIPTPDDPTSLDYQLPYVEPTTP